MNGADDITLFDVDFSSAPSRRKLPLGFGCVQAAAGQLGAAGLIPLPTSPTTWGR